MRMQILCPAKVNLSLVVLQPDSSGYHPLRTVFQAVGLFDELTIESAEVTTIVAEGITLPDDNTISRTLRLVGEALVVPPLAIRLSKRIPAESGLGGGSSDAAGLLLALDPFLVSPIPSQLKHEIAVAVGSDVPFFLVGGRAYAEGYGERLTPLPDADVRWLALARPGVGVSTAEAYRRLDTLEYERPEGAPEGYNDFERVAPCESLDLIERLRHLGGNPATLCGSGSAVFGAFATQAEAEQARSALASEGTPWTAVAPTLGRLAPP